MPTPDEIALVLPGGGAWIYAQAWALHALFSARPDLLGKIKGIYGNSAGSISSACMAAGLVAGNGTELLMEALSEVKQDSDIYTPDVMAFLEHPALHPFTISRASEGLLFGQSAMDQSPLWALLQKHLGQLDTDEVLAKVGVDVAVRAFDSAGQGGVALDGVLWEMAAASSAIECAFLPHKGLSDGGPFDNCPVDLALEAGFQRILVVYCGPEGPLPNLKRVRIDGSYKGPSTPMLARQVAGNLLGKITQNNEDMNSQRLVPWVAQGGSLVECYPAEGVQLGNILDFNLAAQEVRKAAGLTAASVALEAITTQGW